jgi:hypothetical protein
MLRLTFIISAASPSTSIASDTAGLIDVYDVFTKALATITPTYYYYRSAFNFMLAYQGSLIMGGGLVSSPSTSYPTDLEFLPCALLPV